MKIPSTDFNKNNLSEITLKDNLKQNSQNNSNENINLLQADNISNDHSYPKTKAEKKHSEYKKSKPTLSFNNNDLGEFNSNDDSFSKTFSPKTLNTNINNVFNFPNKQQTSIISNNNFHHNNSSKFPKISEIYSDIANILKKDITESIKKEKEKVKEKDKEKEIEFDTTRKYSSLSTNIATSNTLASALNKNSCNLMTLNEKKTEEEDKKKAYKLNLNDILSNSNNTKEE